MRIKKFWANIGFKIRIKVLYGLKFNLWLPKKAEWWPKGCSQTETSKPWLDWKKKKVGTIKKTKKK